MNWKRTKELSNELHFSFLTGPAEPQQQIPLKGRAFSGGYLYIHLGVVLVFEGSPCVFGWYMSLGLYIHVLKQGLYMCLGVVHGFVHVFGFVHAFKQGCTCVWGLLRSLLIS